MTMINKRLLYLFFLLLVLTGCDVIDGPTRQEANNQNPLPQDSVVKKVFLEDYTGHTCGNCPAAARLIYNTIKPMYGDRVVSLGVHAGYFAETCPPHTYPSNSAWPAYSTDFNTPAGTRWFDDYNIQFSPNGMVNRVKVGGNFAVATPQWTARVAALLQLPPEMGIQITADYDASDRLVSTTAVVKTIKEINATCNLVLCIAEDNVKDWQLDYDINPSVPPNYKNNPDYIHRFVLRAAVNGTEGFGEQIIAGNASTGTVVSKSYSYTLPVSWNADECYIIAFVYDATTKEVLQVEEIRLK